jgi:hypothetical protein
MKIACGGYHTMALNSDGEIYAFGAGVYGECGYGENKDTSVPKRVDLPKTADEIVIGVKQMACGGRHNMILSTDGTLFTFGFGQ